MKYFLGLLFLIFSTAGNAEPIYDTYTVVGFECNRAKDILLLTYDGAYDEAGKTMVRNMKPDQWDLWTLYYTNKTIQKQCHLSDGVYELTLSLYHSGTCEVCFGIWAKVIRGGKEIFSRGLDGFEGPPIQTVTARAVIKSHDAEPELTQFSLDDFYERIYSAQ
jgi:hypothetical protein